ncbi:MAG: response regulator [Clostridiales bacterium]|jgi:putative two-component system response regulator|nr:response regulator [Clostridiales bacterium]
MSDKILIVDDNLINLALLSNILEDHYEIITAESGEEAISLLGSQTPDLVLLDVFMPGIDGFGVMEYMKNQKRLANIPVIFVTGADDDISEERGINMGAMDYVRKPFVATIVESKVRNHLELKRYRDSLESMVEKRTKELEERTNQLAASREAIIMGMSLMSETHDKVTGEHITRIKYYTRLISERLSELYPDILPKEAIEDITLFSPLHDLGKVGVPDSILHKSGALTAEEFDIMRKHTVDGGELLRNTGSFLMNGQDGDDLRVAIEIAECHHEKYDGSGYPSGIAGDDIPISARIVALADIYDALRSPRPYKLAFTHNEAKDIILFGDRITRPEHFDPRVLEVFRELHMECDRIFNSSTSH